MRNYNIDEDETSIKLNELALTKDTETPAKYTPMKFTCPAHLCWSCMDVPKKDRKALSKRDKNIFR